MNLLSLLGFETAFSTLRKEGNIKPFDTEVHHYENKKNVSHKVPGIDPSKHWTVDSQFWG
jgi:hypothetical protein